MTNLPPLWNGPQQHVFAWPVCADATLPAPEVPSGLHGSLADSHSLMSNNFPEVHRTK